MGKILYYVLGKPKSYKSFVIKSVLALVVGLVILFAGYTYYDYRQECQENALKEASGTAKNVVSQIDEKLESLKQYYIVMADDESLNWMLENNVDYSDYSNYKKVYDILGGKTIFSDYVQSFTFANFRTNWILSNKGMFPIDEAYNQEWIREIFEYKTNNFEKTFWFYDEGHVITSKINRNYRLTTETNGLNIVMKLPKASYETYGLVIININNATWKKWINSWLDDYEDIVVVDQDNKVIYSTNNEFNDASVNLALANEETGSYTDRENNVYRVGMEYSDVLGWKYYCFYDVYAGQPKLRFPIVLGLCFLIIITILYISIVRIIYGPIKKLIKNVSDEPASVIGNELDYLEGSYQNLKDVVAQQHDKVKELFELRVLHGEVSQDEWADYIEAFDMKTEKFFATTVAILQMDDDEPQSMLNEDAICLKLLQVMPDDVKEKAWMPPIYNSSAIFAIFTGENETDLLDKIKYFYERVMQSAKELGNYGMQMGVSATHTNYAHIRAAYRESINALTLKAQTNDTTSEFDECHFYLQSSTILNKEYNHKFEEEIQTAIKALDKDLCYQVTDEFYLYLSQAGQIEEELEVYVLRYVNTILITAIDAGMDISNIYPDGVRKLYRDLLQVVEPARVRRFIKAHFIDPVLKARMEYLQSHSKNILGQISALIEQSHGDISLTECADKLGVHQTYIWKVLKTEKGKSFSDYQEEYKMEQAKKLLLETNLTVAEIAEQLNYTNAQNFIRFFNKNTGVTPGKFRKLY